MSGLGGPRAQVYHEEPKRDSAFVNFSPSQRSDASGHFPVLFSALAPSHRPRLIWLSVWLSIGPRELAEYVAGNLSRDIPAFIAYICGRSAGVVSRSMG